MTEAHLIGTSGGVGCITGAGFRYGCAQRGLAPYFSASLSSSGDGFNAVSEAAGKLGPDMVEEYRNFADAFINRSSAVKRVLDKLPETSLIKKITYAVLNHPYCLQHWAENIPHEKTKKFVIGLMDGVANFNRMLDENARFPIADMKCVDNLVDKLYSGGGGKTISSYPRPTYMLVYNHKTDAQEYLDVRKFGRKALRATSAITDTVTIDDIIYSDAAFHKPFDYDLLPGTIESKPRVIFINRGPLSARGKFEAAMFFIGQFNKSSYSQFLRNLATEEKKLKELVRHDDVLILRPKVNIGFSTKDPAIIKQGWDEGVKLSEKAEVFFERLDGGRPSRKYFSGEHHAANYEAH